MYCPNCGTKVKEEEHFCIKCGKAIPDIEPRLQKHSFNKWWFLPIGTIITFIIVIAVFNYYLNVQSSKAMELYKEAEELLMDDEYQKANEFLKESVDFREDFIQAQIALEYSTTAMTVEELLSDAKEQLASENYTESLNLLQTAEENLNTYHGPVVSTLVDKIDQSRSIVRLQDLQTKLANEPSINEIRNYIWEAEEINHPSASEIATQLRSQVVDYTFSKASEALNEKQFNDAILITEDGLKYAPESEKLQSLLTNINKEKLTFESEVNKRVEQAMDTAYQEYRKNETDAIELVSLDTDNDQEGHLVINGEVKSIATVPINSILVEYALSRDGEEFFTNEIYVFPDVLYPSAHGRFEFTHFDIEENSSEIKAEVKRITWYTE